eukprot:1159614-Pelagomonas_calceolata.AAC.6
MRAQKPSCKQWRKHEGFCDSRHVPGKQSSCQETMMPREEKQVGQLTCTHSDFGLQKQGDSTHVDEDDELILWPNVWVVQPHDLGWGSSEIDHCCVEGCVAQEGQEHTVCTAAHMPLVLVCALMLGACVCLDA